MSKYIQNKLTNDSSRLAWLTVVICSLTFLLFFRAHWSFGVVWQGDEGCYLAQLGNILGADTSQICTRGENHYAPGTAWFWIIPALLGVVLQHLWSGPLDQWIIPILAIWSFILWSVGVYFFTNSCLFLFESAAISKHSRVMSYMMAFSVPVLYYAVQTPLMSHSIEFFVASLFLHFFIQKRVLITSILAILITLIRYNDAPIILMVLALWHTERKSASVASTAQKLIVLLTCILVMGLIIWIGLIHGYGGFVLSDILADFKLKNIPLFLFGNDWGIFWISPLWILALIAVPVFNLWKKSPIILSAWLWLVGEAVLVIIWGTNGARFGQRYLIGSYIATIPIWHAFLVLKPNWKKLFFITLFYQTAIILYTSITYESIRHLSIAGYAEGFDDYSFLLESVRFAFDGSLWKNAFEHQFPLVTIFISLTQRDNPAYLTSIVTGPALLILILSTSLSCAFVFYGILRFFHVHPHANNQILKSEK